MLCSPQAWNGLLHGGLYYKAAPILNMVLLLVGLQVRNNANKCSLYSLHSCAIAASSVTQPTDTDQLNTQCSTLLLQHSSCVTRSSYMILPVAFLARRWQGREQQMLEMNKLLITLTINHNNLLY